MRRLALLFVALVAFATAFRAEAEDRIVVFAAASLKTALDAAAASYHAGGGGEVAISYGGSLALARQIIAGAPADIFGSADEPSMDEAAKNSAIRADSRFDLLSNRLVLVAPKSAAIDSLALDRDALTKAIGDGRVATGEVETVPVGRYAKASLTKLGLWEAVEPHLAMTDNVRAALAFVARGEAKLGIVYATDAAAEPGVKIVATFPDDTHPPITYPFAITAGSHNAAAAKFLGYLKSPEAREIFKGQGFGVAP
jgi:molybdate transport system substrate-binding protein